LLIYPVSLMKDVYDDDMLKYGRPEEVEVDIVKAEDRSSFQKLIDRQAAQVKPEPKKGSRRR
jgi:hypothetical protein